jgi:RNA polymerase sigma-70 factor (ECF subfamily)
MPLFYCLHNFTHWLTQNREEAEDLVQQACAKTLKGCSCLQPRTDCRAWIYRILSNTFSLSAPGRIRIFAIQKDANSWFKSQTHRRMAMESIGCIQDSFLIREAQGGNRAAFEQLVHAHDQAVLRLAIRIAGSHSDAQDIYQEAFLKVYTKLGGFRSECSFSTWIYRIVTNVCLDHLRKNRKRRGHSTIEVNVEGEEYDLPNQVSDDRPANNPEQQLFRRELRAHILCALQRLTPRERMVFELKYFQGLKLRAISEILNTSEGSIKNSLLRATQKLRFQLALSTKGRNVRCSSAVTPEV